jgi:hypothetical protein
MDAPINMSTKKQSLQIIHGAILVLSFAAWYIKVFMPDSK